jgi:hypothetical protein
MPEEDPPQITIERLEFHLGEVAKGLAKLEKETQAVLNEWRGKRGAASGEPETPTACEGPAETETPAEAA